MRTPSCFWLAGLLLGCGAGDGGSAAAGGGSATTGGGGSATTGGAGGAGAAQTDAASDAAPTGGSGGAPDAAFEGGAVLDVAPNPVCTTMIAIPAGDAFIGCNGAVDKECYQKEKPGHTVTLSAFEIDACEVTTAEYRSCVSAGACTVPKNPCVNPSACDLPKMCNFHTPGRDAHPINCVMWGEADSYCKWVGPPPPPEAEWEKAGRGSDGRKYPWGNAPAPSCERAAIDDNGALVPGGEGCSTGGTLLPGQKPAGASPYGVHDMLGNVWEWVSDWYAVDYFASSPTNDPQGPATGTTKVYKGDGWWDAQDRFLRLSFRTDETLHYKRNNLGFRCAR